MPFESEKQRAYMHIHHPEIAKQWEHEAKAKHQAPVKHDIGKMNAKAMLKACDEKAKKPC